MKKFVTDYAILIGFGVAAIVMVFGIALMSGIDPKYLLADAKTKNTTASPTMTPEPTEEPEAVQYQPQRNMQQTSSAQRVAQPTVQVQQPQTQPAQANSGVSCTTVYGTYTVRSNDECSYWQATHQQVKTNMDNLKNNFNNSASSVVIAPPPQSTYQPAQIEYNMPQPTPMTIQPIEQPRNCEPLHNGGNIEVCK